MRKASLLAYIILLMFAITPFDIHARNDNDPAALYNRAGALYREGKFPEALELYEQLIEQGIDPRIILLYIFYLTASVHDSGVITSS